MEPAHSVEAFEHDNDASIGDILKQLDPYIVALVSKRACGSSNVGHAGMCAIDMDDMIQEARFKFWMALSRRRIEHKKAYLRVIVQNEFNDIPRGRKQPLPLLTDDDGELFMGDLLIVATQVAANPEDVFVERESFRELLDFLLYYISRLPPRQRRVMICRLYEALGERLDVMEAFGRFAITSDIYLWPEDEDDKRLLQASHPEARRNLSKSIECAIAQGQWMRVPERIKVRVPGV